MPPKKDPSPPTGQHTTRHLPATTTTTRKSNRRRRPTIRVPVTTPNSSSSSSSSSAAAPTTTQLPPPTNPPHPRTKRVRRRATSGAAAAAGSASAPPAPTSSASETSTCGVCFEESYTISGKIDSCTHSFCWECIEKWSQSSNTCPLCKRRFRSIVKFDIAKKKQIKKIKVDQKDLGSTLYPGFPQWIFNGTQPTPQQVQQFMQQFVGLGVPPGFATPGFGMVGLPGAGVHFTFQGQMHPLTFDDDEDDDDDDEDDDDDSEEDDDDEDDDAAHYYFGLHNDYDSLGDSMSFVDIGDEDEHCYLCGNVLLHGECVDCCGDPSCQNCGVGLRRRMLSTRYRGDGSATNPLDLCEEDDDDVCEHNGGRRPAASAAAASAASAAAAPTPLPHPSTPNRKRRGRR